MRGTNRRSGELFSYINQASRMRTGHPFRTCAIADDALVALSKNFARLCSGMVRPSIAPAMLLQAFHSVRSDLQLIERLEFDLLVRRPRRQWAGVEPLGFITVLCRS